MYTKCVQKSWNMMVKTLFDDIVINSIFRIEYIFGVRVYVHVHVYAYAYIHVYVHLHVYVYVHVYM